MLCAAAPRQSSRSVDAANARMATLKTLGFRSDELLRIDFERTDFGMRLMQLQPEATRAVGGQLNARDGIWLGRRT